MTCGSSAATWPLDGHRTRLEEGNKEAAYLGYRPLPFKMIYFIIYLYVCSSLSLFVCSCVYGDKERVLGLLKLEVQDFVSFPMWVLRTELRFSTLNH